MQGAWEPSSAKKTPAYVIVGGRFSFEISRNPIYPRVVFRFTRLPKPMRANPIKSMLIGSENDRLKISGVSAIPAGALTQKSNTVTTPNICKINRLIFFIITSINH
jgi:hypothetical protein